jgi:hypothetical protein
MSQVNRNASGWTLNGRKVEGCLAIPSYAHCKLQISLYILIAIIVCNFIKSAAMIWTLWYQHEMTFVTFGDALSSWLDVPDLSTKGRCLTRKHDIQSKSQQKGYRLQPLPTVYAKGREDFWYRAVSSERRFTTLYVCFMAAIAASASGMSTTLSLCSEPSVERIHRRSIGIYHADEVVDLALIRRHMGPDQGTLCRLA